MIFEPDQVELARAGVRFARAASPESVRSSSRRLSVFRCVERCEVGQPRAGHVARTHEQRLQAAHGRDVLEPPIGDPGVVEDEAPQALVPSQPGQAGVGDPRLGQVQGPQRRQAAQIAELIVRDARRVQPDLDDRPPGRLFVKPDLAAQAPTSATTRSRTGSPPGGPACTSSRFKQMSTQKIRTSTPRCRRPPASRQVKIPSLIRGPPPWRHITKMYLTTVSDTVRPQIARGDGPEARHRARSGLLRLLVDAECVRPLEAARTGRSHVSRSPGSAIVPDDKLTIASGTSKADARPLTADNMKSLLKVPAARAPGKNHRVELQSSVERASQAQVETQPAQQPCEQADVPGKVKRKEPPDAPCRRQSKRWRRTGRSVRISWSYRAQPVNKWPRTCGSSWLKTRE